jgi:hypothetical protein
MSSAKPSTINPLLLLAKKLAGKKMKRERSCSPETRRPKEYAGAGVHPDVKTHTAQLAVALQGRGVAVATVLDALSETLYAPKERTLLRHMAQIKGGEAPLSTEKVTGRAPALTEEQWEIVFGRILLGEKIVSLEDV